MNKSKIFNIKMFVIFICVVFAVVVTAAIIMNTANKQKFENKKQQAKENPMKVYENNINSTLSDFITACGWKKEDVACIVLGVDTGNSKIDKCYVDDKEVMDRIFKEFEDVTFYGASESVAQKRDNQSWSIQFIKNGEEHSLFLRGYAKIEDSIELCDAVTCYAEYDSVSNDSFPYVREDKGDYNMLYGEDMYGKLLKIYNEYIDEMTIGNVTELKSNNRTELTDYFRYDHTFKKSKNFIDETGERRTTCIYVFTIKDSECYMEVEKYNEFSEVDEFKCLDIMAIEIYNSEGDSIDFMNCTMAELEEFIK